MRLGKVTWYCQPSRNSSESIVTGSSAEVTGYKRRKILPAQAFLLWSSRSSSCLMRSQETVNNIGLRRTKFLSFSSRLTSGEPNEAGADWATNWPETLRD